MKLTEFKDFLEKSTEQFYKVWCEKNEKLPTNYPMEMDLGDWLEQYDMMFYITF
jgi:hypothetical protein